MSDLPLISVCIPIFNSDATSLVNKLVDQANNLENRVEIVVIDDCSSVEWKLKNETINNLCNYVQLSENSGRSKIRNSFLNYARGDFFLFIDGDSEIISDNFLMDYINFTKKNNPDVLVGGSVYQNKKPNRSQLLRWKYSIYRESKPAELREKINLGFKTNNFLIRRGIFSRTPFSETLIGYGHEDTFFGIQLDHQKSKIQHIENPVLNKQLDTNAVFLKKTENSTSNLIYIYSFKDKFPKIREIKLIQAYERLSKQNLCGFVLRTFNLTENGLLFFLKKGLFALWMFDFYKLGLFIRKIKS